MSKTEGEAAHINEIARWQDRRSEARAKAKEQTDAARKGAIAALAHRSRQDAKERGASRYVGAPCTRHDNAERHTPRPANAFSAIQKWASCIVPGEASIFWKAKRLNTHGAADNLTSSAGKSGTNARGNARAPVGCRGLMVNESIEPSAGALVDCLPHLGGLWPGSSKTHGRPFIEQKGTSEGCYNLDFYLLEKEFSNESKDLTSYARARK